MNTDEQLDEAMASIERADAMAIEAIRAKADFAKGNPGECDYCGEYSPRLIGMACAPCRTRYRLK
jgi:hypothetical protein